MVCQLSGYKEERETMLIVLHKVSIRCDSQNGSCSDSLLCGYPVIMILLVMLC